MKNSGPPAGGAAGKPEPRDDGSECDDSAFDVNFDEPVGVAELLLVGGAGAAVGVPIAKNFGVKATHEDTVSHKGCSPRLGTDWQSYSIRINCGDAHIGAPVIEDIFVVKFN